MTSELGGFTPVPHSLAKEVGLVCAAVYGLVWRYCQMKDKNCKASLDTLGADINVDRATVMRSIKKLCELGYLIDQTPGRRNAPHTYTLSKSVALCNTFAHNDMAMHSESVAQDNTTKPTVADSNATVAQRNATVAESHLKIDSKIEDITTTRDAAARKLEIIYLSGAGGRATQTGVDLVNDMLNTYPAEVIIYACGEAEKNTTPKDDKRNLKYIEAVCKRKVSGQPDRVKARDNGHYSTGQNNTGANPQLEGGGLSETSKALAAAWESKRRRSRSPT